MRSLLKIKFTLLYLVSIVAVSGLFVHYPLLISIAPEVDFTPWAVLVGAWFVLRDYSQREIGHWVFIPMAIGVVVCALFSPALALASASASVAAEMTDWAIYTFLKRPFYQRVIISSLFSVVVDTIVFFGAFDWFQVIPGVTIFNWPTIAVGCISKAVACVVVYVNYRNSLKKPVAVKKAKKK